MKRVLFWFAVSTMLAVAATLVTTPHRRPQPGTEVGDRDQPPPESPESAESPESPPNSSPQKEVPS